MRNVLGALLGLCAGAASAEGLVIPTFKGPGAEAVRGKIVQGLCDVTPCLPPAKLVKGGKPDWGKAKKQKVDFFILGTVKAKGGKHTLELKVLAKPGAPPKLKKSFTWTGSELSDPTLKQVLSALRGSMGLAEVVPVEAPPDEPPPAAEPKEAPKPEAKPEAQATAVEPKPKEVEPPPPPPNEEERAQQDEEPPADTASAAAPRKAPFLAIDLGVDLFSRSYAYLDQQSNNLRSYNAGLVVAPAGRIEFYPLALFTKGLLTGLGVDGSFAMAVGLSSRRSGTTTTWPTTLYRYDASLRFRIRLSDTLDAAVIPFVGYASRTFSVGTGTDGSTLDGLPSFTYSAVRAGIGGDVPFGSSGVLLFAKLDVLIVLSSAQIIGPPPAFFPRGSNFGFEGELGLGYRLVGPLQLRAAFEFTRYGLSFRSEPTDTYRAAGAADTYLGGNASVRLTF